MKERDKSLSVLLCDCTVLRFIVGGLIVLCMFLGMVLCGWVGIILD